MYTVYDDETFEDGVRLIRGVLNGKAFSLVFEDNIWIEQTGNFDINSIDFKLFIQQILA